MGRVLDAGVDKGGVEGKLPTVTWNRNAPENQQLPTGNCLHRQNSGNKKAGSRRSG